MIMEIFIDLIKIYLIINMRTLILISLVLLSFKTSAQISTVNCESIKTGVFMDSNEELNMNVKVIRTDDFQIEEYEKGEMTVKLEVIWVNKCTYKLVFVEGNKVWNDKFGKHGNPNLLVNIIEVGKDYYIQESHFEGQKEQTYITKMYKVE